MMMKKVMAINPPAPPKNALVMFAEPGSGAFDDTVLLACSTRPGGRPADPTSIRLKFQSKFSTPQLTSDAESQVKSSRVKSYENRVPAPPGVKSYENRVPAPPGVIEPDTRDTICARKAPFAVKPERDETRSCVSKHVLAL